MYFLTSIRKLLRKFFLDIIFWITEKFYCHDEVNNKNLDPTLPTFFRKFSSLRLLRRQFFFSKENSNTSMIYPILGTALGSLAGNNTSCCKLHITGRTCTGRRIIIHYTISISYNQTIQDARCDDRNFSDFHSSTQFKTFA